MGRASEFTAHRYGVCRVFTVGIVTVALGMLCTWLPGAFGGLVCGAGGPSGRWRFKSYGFWGQMTCNSFRVLTRQLEPDGGLEVCRGSNVVSFGGPYMRL